MSLQVLQRLSDYNREVKEYVLNIAPNRTSEITPADYYSEFNTINKPRLIAFDFNHLRDYAIFVYQSIKDQNKVIK